MYAKWRVKVITWNVAETEPPEELKRLLGLDSKSEPDIYAIGLQELNSSVTALTYDAFTNDSWTRRVSAHLCPRGYLRLKTIRMMGIHLAVYVRKVHLAAITGIEATYTRTGFGGLWGNKGAVSIRLDIYNVNICFVNCHFTAHHHNYTERIQDYDQVVSSQIFSNPQCSNILDHDYVFWLGDLNFRVDNMSKSEIEAKVKDRDYPCLVKNDQLKRALGEELILLDFSEGPIYFPPTYKYDMGTDTYDTSKKQRKPSYCDRVLYFVHQDAFEGVELGVEQHNYTCLMEYKTSDHKPVVSDFAIETLMYDSPPLSPIMFEPLDVWCCSKDAECTYQVSLDFPTSSWDWIGLYKANYADWRDYVTYMYAPGTWETISGDDSKYFTFTIDKQYLKELVGNFYLAYYSADKGYLCGYSNMFSISLTEDSSDSDDEDPFRKKAN